MICRIALAVFVLASMPLYATTYTLEPDYTQGVFRWNHLGFSSPAAQFAQGGGTLEFDQADPSKSSVTVTIPLGSLYTGVPALTIFGRRIFSKQPGSRPRHSGAPGSKRVQRQISSRSPATSASMESPSRSY